MKMPLTPEVQRDEKGSRHNCVLDEWTRGPWIMPPEIRMSFLRSKITVAPQKPAAFDQGVAMAKGLA
jgi:hypothetical protein